MKLSLKEVGLALGVVLVLGPVLLAKPPKKPQLRFPFGLTAVSAPANTAAVLKEKGLSLLSQKETPTGYASDWKLSGQLNFESFTPQEAAAIFEKNQLASFAAAAKGLTTCNAAQASFVAAMTLVRTSYDAEDAPVTQEPSDDTIDCGPHFKSSNYTLRTENKKYVATVTLEKTLAGYDVTLTYFSRPSMRPATEDDNSPKAKEKRTLQENL